MRGFKEETFSQVELDEILQLVIEAALEVLDDEMGTVFL